MLHCDFQVLELNLFAASRETLHFQCLTKKMSIFNVRDIAVDSTKSSDFPNHLQFKQLGRDKSLDSQTKRLLKNQRALTI